MNKKTIEIEENLKTENKEHSLTGVVRKKKRKGKIVYIEKIEFLNLVGLGLFLFCLRK